MTRKEAIEIPFGAEDSELIKWEYTIPEGMEAEIKDGKVIIKKAESEDERIRRYIIGVTNEWWDRLGNPSPDYPTRDEMLAYLEKQKEQKPVKLDDDTEVGLDRALQIVKDAKGNLCGYQSDDGIYECDHAIRTLERILKNGIEQKSTSSEKPKEWKPLSESMETKPAEWSDYKDKVNVPYCSSESEWSEKDEKMLASIIKCAENDFHIHEYQRTWLKSLRPSWKPSEQEKGALRTAISILTEERSFPKAAAHLQAILDAFDGKEVRKEWKPSEEQMSALNYFIKLWGNSDDQLEYTQIFINVKSLYEQLKKLM